MEKAGVLHRVITGVYLSAIHQRSDLTASAAWTLRYPSAVACLLTAAVHHRLTDAFTHGTWLYVPKGTTVPRSRTSALQVVQTSPRYVDPAHDEEYGVITKIVHQVPVRLTGPDRTVLDLWRYPRRISVEHATTALRTRVRAEDFSLPKFARLGRKLRVWRRLDPIVLGLMLG